MRTIGHQRKQLPAYDIDILLLDVFDKNPPPEQKIKELFKLRSKECWILISSDTQIIKDKNSNLLRCIYHFYWER